MGKIKAKWQYETDLNKVREIAMLVWGRADGKSLDANLEITGEELRALYDFIDAYCVYDEDGRGVLRKEFKERQ